MTGNTAFRSIRASWASGTVGLLQRYGNASYSPGDDLSGKHPQRVGIANEKIQYQARGVRPLYRAGCSRPRTPATG
jgi:hypothetical protein